MTDWTSPAEPLADWSAFDDLVRRRRRFVLTTHVNPDGDGLGSEAALAVYLRALGKEVRIVNDGALPDNLAFLSEVHPFDRYDASRADELFADAETLVILDTPSRSRLGGVRRELDRPGLEIVVIDHHLGDIGFADLVIVNTEACATGELIYDCVRRTPEHWTRGMAEAIYAAVVTDTGSFRHSNTDPSTHAMTAHLLALGVEPEKMAARIYRYRHPDRVRFLGSVLQQLQLNEAGTVAWLEVPRLLLERYRMNGQDTEGLVDFPRTLPGVEAVALFTESDNGAVKVSLRSAGLVDVNRVAVSFGGGGHRVAAGALLEGPLEGARARVLTALEEALQEARGAVPGAESGPS